MSGWQTQAGCRGMDPRLFYPQGPLSNAFIAQAERARAVCAGCPVVQQCLADTLTAEKGTPAADREGILAGLDGRERYALQRGSRMPRRPLPIPDDGREHGSRRTYKQGCKCWACTAAESPVGRRSRKASATVSSPAAAPVPECGTRQASSRHQRLGEPQDAACQQARRDLYRSWYQQQPATSADCGTRTGYRWHLVRGEDPCPSCTAADEAAAWYLRQNTTFVTAA